MAIVETPDVYTIGRYLAIQPPLLQRFTAPSNNTVNSEQPKEDEKTPRRGGELRMRKRNHIHTTGEQGH